MSKITVDFEFEIGDLVYMKSEIVDFNNKFKPLGDKNRQTVYMTISEMEIVMRKPNPFMILTRCSEECHGGIQKVYDIRRQTSQGFITAKLFELELTKSLDLIS